jgi:hypothetical protein
MVQDLNQSAVAFAAFAYNAAMREPPVLRADMVAQ